MKIKALLFIVGIFILCFLSTKPYVELNQLNIIESMTVVCQPPHYQVTLVEVIPVKDDNGIEYQHKKYVHEGTSLSFVKRLFDQDSKHTFYYHGIQKLSTNCTQIKEIKQLFSLRKNVIIQKKKD